MTAAPRPIASPGLCRLQQTGPARSTQEPPPERHKPSRWERFRDTISPFRRQEAAIGPRSRGTAKALADREEGSGCPRGDVGFHGWLGREARPFRLAPSYELRQEPSPSTSPPNIPALDAPPASLTRCCRKPRGRPDLRGYFTRTAAIGSAFAAASGRRTKKVRPG